jgi:hypothetical protein
MRFLAAAVLLGVSPFLALGVWMIGKGIGNIQQSQASLTWPKTEAIVTKSVTGVSTSTDISNRTRSTSFSADLEFQYTVNGSAYKASTRHFGQTEGSTDSSEAELLRLRYPQGARIPIFYNPAGPEVAVAEPGFHANLLWLPGGGLFFVVPSLMFVVLFFGRDSPSFFGAGLVMFGGMFISLGLLGLLYGGLQILRGHESTGWPRAQGEIVYDRTDTSEAAVKVGAVKTIQRSRGAHLVYRYDVDGRTYFANQRQFGQLASAGAQWADGIAAKYPPGARIPIAYSPDSPQLSVVEPGVTSEALWLPGGALAALLFGLAAAGPARRALAMPGPGAPPVMSRGDRRRKKRGSQGAA